MGIKCLILAAGNGSRLRQKGVSKPLVPLLGIPLIERAIRSAMEAGADDFYVVTGYQGDLVRDFLERLAKRLAIRITPLVNDDWEKENGLSVLKAREVLHEPFLLLMADHLFDPGLASALTTHSQLDGEIAVLLQASVVEPFPLRQNLTWRGLKSNLENPAATIIKTNKKYAARLVNTSRKESLFLASPACMAGVLIVVPNFKARCGRRKL